MRIGLVDIAAAGVTLVAILLPPPRHPIEPVLTGERTWLVAEAQADLLEAPDSGAAARRLADRLIEAGESDGAIRMAAAAAARGEKSPDRWRALLAVSEGYLHRLDLVPALEWAEKAVAACETEGAECPPIDSVRLGFYRNVLQAGVDSGIDPKVDPKAFDEAVRRKLPSVHFSEPTKKKRPDGPRTDR